MKLEIEIPDDKIPLNVRRALNEGNLTEHQHRDVVEALLMLVTDDFDECEISVSQYKLVLK